MTFSKLRENMNYPLVDTKVREPFEHTYAEKIHIKPDIKI